jgi:hypothetical protein
MLPSVPLIGLGPLKIKGDQRGVGGSHPAWRWDFTAATETPFLAAGVGQVHHPATKSWRLNDPRKGVLL